MAELINGSGAEQPVKKARARNNDNNTVPITDIIYRTLHYWPWVLLSVLVCVGIGVIYLLRTPNVYTQTASILIKDDTKSGKSVSGGEEFSDLGLFQNNTNIQNEITTLKSSSTMNEVVSRLNLDVNYYTAGTFHDNVAYGTTLPVKVSFVNYPANGSASFDLDVAKDGKFTISEITEGGREISGNITGALGDTVNSKIGTLVVAKTPYYIGDASISLKVNKIPVEAAAGSYRARLGVVLSDEKSSVVDLTISDLSVERADDVLSALITVYNENWINDKNQIAVSTSNFINERLNVIESELGNVDSDISSYKSEHLIPNVEAASGMYMAQNQQISQEIFALKNQLQLTNYIRSYITSDDNRDRLLPTNTGVENVNIQGQISEYNDKILTRNNLLAKSSEKNPLVIAIDEQLAAIRSAMIASIDNSIVALNTQIRNLQGSQASTTSKLASNPSQAKYLLSVERQQKVKESLYLFLLQKREENELSQAFTAYNTRIMEQPGGSTAPTSPKRSSILLVAFAIGLAIPFAIVFAKEMSNTKVRGRKDVEHLVTPFLGEIPMHGKEDRTDRTFVVRDGSRNIINEAFRVLRTNFEFMRADKQDADVIAVTSFNPGSGKSFLTMNLAVSLALKSQRVLVIDGDMRHGSSSAYVGTPSQGLSNYLSGAESDADSIIVKSADVPNLWVLPIGSIPPNPTELLETEHFGKLIASQRTAFDYIIIDCPPIEVVADAQIIDRYVDRTVFVVRAGLLERSMLPELDRLYEEKKYHNMAFVLNATRNDQGRYGYSHSYRYGYGYGYGYGYNYGEKQKKHKSKKSK